MSFRSVWMGAFVLTLSATGFPDDVLLRYEADVLPYDETAGWLVAHACETPCTESVEDGHFVLRWAQPNDIANYHRWISEAPDEPPPRSGSSGVFVRIILWGRSSFLATDDLL